MAELCIALAFVAFAFMFFKVGCNLGETNTKSEISDKLFDICRQLGLEADGDTFRAMSYTDNKEVAIYIDAAAADINLMVDSVDDEEDDNEEDDDKKLVKDFLNKLITPRNQKQQNLKRSRHTKVQAVTGNIDIEVPLEERSTSVLYFQRDNEEDTTWTIYIWNADPKIVPDPNGKWLYCGDTEIDLSDYRLNDNAEDGTEEAQNIIHNALNMLKNNEDDEG